MEMIQKRCKVCGRLFTPRSASDEFCPGLCSTAGGLIAGRGDTTKPSTEYKAKKPRKPKVVRETVIATAVNTKPVRTRVPIDRFPRVMEMFRHPENERFEIAKTFTREEQEYARKIGKRMLAEERRLDAIIDWNGGDENLEKLERYRHVEFDRLGESDDGSI